MREKTFVEKFMTRLGFVNSGMNLDQFHAFLKKDRASFEKFVSDMGIPKK